MSRVGRTRGSVFGENYPCKWVSFGWTTTNGFWTHLPHSRIRHGHPDGMSRPTAEAIRQRLTALADLDTQALKKLWPDHFGIPAPKGLSADLLRRAIAYEIQARAYGGLRPATIRQLEALAGLRTDGRKTRPSAPRLQPGTRLLREWQGETHAVEVLTDGYAWRGQRYRSLSVIARAITGAQWSGPRFFGVRTSAEQIARNPAS